MGCLQPPARVMFWLELGFSHHALLRRLRRVRALLSIFFSFFIIYCSPPPHSVSRPLTTPPPPPRTLPLHSSSCWKNSWQQMVTAETNVMNSWKLHSASPSASRLSIRPSSVAWSFTCCGPRTEEFTAGRTKTRHRHLRVKVNNKKNTDKTVPGA